MKVYIITGVAFPYGMAEASRVLCLAKAYIREGIRCEIVVFQRSSSNKSVEKSGCYDGVPYFYLGGSSKRAKGKIAGKIQSLYLRLYLLWFLFWNLSSNDAVLVYHKYNNLFRDLLLRIIHSRKSYYLHELCEYPFISLHETTQTEKHRKYELKHLFPRYDGVIAISDTLVQLAKEHCSPDCVITKIPILVDFKKYAIPDNYTSVKIPFIFHAGSLTEQKDGILRMLEAFGIAENQMTKSIEFWLTGSMEKSPHKVEIKEIINKYGLEDKIRFLGYLSEEELKDNLSKSSLVIINKYATLQNKYNFSTKLGEYLAAGKTLIITKVGEAMNWLTDKKDCIIVEPENTHQLAAAISWVFEHIDECQEIKKQARKLCKESFDYTKNSKELKEMLNKIIKKHGKDTCDR